MKRVPAIFGGFTIVTSLAFCQTPPSPTFEAADVHVSPPAANQFLQTHSAPNGRYELRNATIVDLVRTAYGVDGDSVFGGPSWADTDRFDVLAKAPAMSSDADRLVMLRALLSDRLKLVLHNQDKPQDIFALTAGKRPTMKESEGSGPAKCDSAQPPSNDPLPYIILNCTNMSMAEFAKQFRQMAGGYVTHTMVDLTGLKGNYDFNIKWSPRGRLMQLQAANDPNADPGISFFEAVDKQLGLKLAPEKRPVPSLVIDTVERVPVPNPPGVKTYVPVIPTEFDAAVVKPSKPDAVGARFQPKPGGQLQIENAPLKLMIAAGWSFENEDYRVVGAPKWVDSEKFDIVAKTNDFPVNSPPPIDSVRIMLRNLLIERFKLAAHMEDQNMPVWLFTIAKGGAKLKPADPQSRSTCKAAPGNVNGSPVVNLVCTNTTMEQLATQMRQTGGGGGYLDRAAVDATGIKGGYDFTLSWTPKNIVQGGGRGGDAPAGTASDPSGGITLFDATEKQLGLHLETGKHPLSVLVVDKVEHLVTEN